MMPALIQRLRERKIGQWSIAYLAAAWVLLQIVDVLAEPFGLAVGPTTRALTVLLAWGFLGTLVVAWFHAEKGRQRVGLVEVALLAGLGVAGVASAVVGFGIGDLEPAVEAPSRLASVLQGPVVAVLPFTNASEAAKGAAFLASGIHGEILTHLSKLSGVNAISRTSVMGYDRVGRTVRQIAEDLGASAILEGTIQRAGNTIRINVTLIDALNDTQLWGDVYDRVLEPTSVFAVQGEIASRVADALAVALAPDEQSRLTQVPTTDEQAFELYLLGKEAEYRAGRGEFELYATAYEHYGAALERDSLYAEAHAAIANVEERLYFSSRGDERVPERIERMRVAAERAIELDPELARGHLVLGNYYMTHRHDAVRAQESYLRARRFDPDNVLALRGLAALSMKAGDWEGARADLRRAADLDPREPQVQILAANLAFYTRRFEEVELRLRRLLGMVKLLYAGEPIGGGMSTTARLLRLTYQQLLSTVLAADGDPDRAVATLNEMTALAGLTPREITPFLNDYYPAHPAPYGAALLSVDEVRDVVENHPGFQERHWKNIVAKAWFLRWAGEDAEEERRIWGVWGDLLIEAAMPELGTELEIRSYVALMYARAGRGEDAVAQLNRAMEIADPYLWVSIIMNAEMRWAMTLVELGDHGQALDMIEDMLSRPSALSVNLLKVQPEWDPIRELPRFRALLEQYGA